MKSFFAVAPLLSLLLTGCGEKPVAAGKSDSSANPADAPTDYLKSTAQSQPRAIKAVDTVALNKAVELFYVQEGRFPSDLDEVVEKKLIRVIPPAPAGMKIVYDAKTGVVMVDKE